MNIVIHHGDYGDYYLSLTDSISHWLYLGHAQDQRRDNRRDNRVLGCAAARD